MPALKGATVIGTVGGYSAATLCISLFRLGPSKQMGSCCSAGSPVSDPGYSVVRVIDGDTVEIEFTERGERVKRSLRFFGVDAPECRPLHARYPGHLHALHKRAGLAVKEYVQKLVGQSINDVRVEIHPTARDKYGRLIGTLYLGGVNLSEHLLAIGAVERIDKTRHTWDEADLHRAIDAVTRAR